MPHRVAKDTGISNCLLSARDRPSGLQPRCREAIAAAIANVRTSHVLVATLPIAQTLQKILLTPRDVRALRSGCLSYRCAVARALAPPGAAAEALAVELAGALPESGLPTGCTSRAIAADIEIELGERALLDWLRGQLAADGVSRASSAVATYLRERCWGLLALHAEVWPEGDPWEEGLRLTQPADWLLLRELLAAVDALQPDGCLPEAIALDLGAAVLEVHRCGLTAGDLAAARARLGLVAIAATLL